MWRFSKNTVSSMMKNICGDVFQRPLRDEFILYFVTSHFVAG
jgi:hypothetical protein